MQVQEVVLDRAAHAAETAVGLRPRGGGGPARGLGPAAPLGALRAPRRRARALAALDGALALLGGVLALAALASQMRHITYDTSTESFFRQDDPALVEYNHFREVFGRDEFLIAAINPPEVFDAAFLTKLAAFTHALQTQVPHLKDVTSLIDVRDTRGEGDRLVVEDLIKHVPQTPQAMAALKRRVLSSELYPNLFISADGRFTTVLIETQACSGGKTADLSAGFGDVSVQPGPPAPAAITGTALAMASRITRPNGSGRSE